MGLGSVSEWIEETGRSGVEEVELLTGLFSKWLGFSGEGPGCSAQRERRSS